MNSSSKENRTFTDEDINRIDSVYEQTLQYCRFLIGNDSMEYDISVLGPIADTVVETLINLGFNVWFPYEDETGCVNQYFSVKS